MTVAPLPEAPPEEAPPQGRIPPHSKEAEEALIGSMLLSRSAIEHALSALRPEDFYLPQLGQIFGAIGAMTGEGQPCDPTTLFAFLARQGLPIERKLLLELQAQTPASANAPQYAALIAEAASRRRLAHAASQIARLAFDEQLAAPEAVATAQDLIRGADIALGGAPSPDIGEFLSQRHEYRWVWPQHLEEGERLIIVAPEKFGKTTMIRQIAILLSQGQDPFRLESIPPALVHMIDLENPPALIRRKMAEIFATVNTLEKPAATDTLRIDCRPEGIDIANSRADLMWLQDRVAANKQAWERMGWGHLPFVLCIGPVYKLHEDELSLQEVRKVQKALDQIRTRYRCALIMETHAPHESFASKAPPRSLRPAGPRVWLRWPEFCRAIEPATGIAVPEQGPNPLADFYDVQGARDERSWPSRLRRGGRLPWLEERF